MQFTTAIVALFASAAVAAPTIEEARQVPYLPCGGQLAAQCCATDVLGVADLDCANPNKAPLASPEEFQQVCSDVGQRARCCLLPILGQALICSTPAGVTK